MVALMVEMMGVKTVVLWEEKVERSVGCLVTAWAHH